MPATMAQDTSVTVETNSPEQITAILMNDGKWHTVENCKLIQYAIGEAHSPVYPTKLYPYLTFRDVESGKKVKVPFKQIVAFETKNT